MKKLSAAFLVALPLTLAACSSTPKVPAEAVIVTKISGTVTAGSGTGSVTLSGKSGVLATGPIDASGNFTLDLPGADKLSAELMTASDALSGVGCSGTLTSSDPAAKGYGMMPLTATRTGLNELVLPADLSVGLVNSSVAAKAWLYTDKATTLQGQLDCSSLVQNVATVKLNINLTTKVGWNSIAINASGLTLSRNLSGDVTLAADQTSTWLTAGQLTSKLPGM